MAVTHSDLAPSPKHTDLNSKTGVLITLLTILIGLLCFILCLIAEANRSQVTWVRDSGKGTAKYECVYSGNGKVPLLCTCVAFLGLAIAVVIQHLFILIAITKSPLIDLDYVDSSSPTKSLTWIAGFSFVSTWICFAVGEILMLIGISVESGHLSNWSDPKPTCLIVREGLFSAAAIFSLITVFLATLLYLTALRAEKISHDIENVRREVIEASVLYMSPPSTPLNYIAAVHREDPVTRNEQSFFTYYPSLFIKQTAVAK